MKTIVITEGASGIGLELTKKYINDNNYVIVIGHRDNGTADIINNLDNKNVDNLEYIQADLSLVVDNKKVVNLITSKYESIDKLILCATKHNHTYTTTKEGIEASFALDYLSRYILSHGLKDVLNSSTDKQIVNLCGTGYKGNVSFTDLEHKEKFNPMTVMMYGSRLNELLAVNYCEVNPSISYLLINPGPVATPGMKRFMNTKLKWAFYKLISKSPYKASTNLVDITHQE